MGSGDNHKLAREVITASPADTQIGGGVRTEERASGLFAIGARRVVVGTRAVDDRPWLEKLAAANPGKVVVAADVNEGKVLRKGWTESSALRIEPFGKLLQSSKHVVPRPRSASSRSWRRSRTCRSPAC